MPVLRVDIPDALDGERVDRALALLMERPRTAVAGLLDAGAVAIDGTVVGKSHRLAAGDTVTVSEEVDRPAPPAAAPVDVEVRFSDDDLVVVAKAAGVVVHPGAGHRDDTLVQGLLNRFPDMAGVGESDRPGIVHRLDRDTSGLLVAARTATAYDGLVAQLAAREVERRYLALVWGSPDAERGLIDAPIGRSQARRTRMAVRSSGREARTGYEVLERFENRGVSLLRCRLETGRTHQIRVHCAAIGHPVVGDAEYGGARSGVRLDRLFLHAEYLRFCHPRTGEVLSFEEPLPPELATVLDGLRDEAPA